jgi:hypothetical protein
LKIGGRSLGKPDDLEVLLGGGEYRSVVTHPVSNPAKIMAKILFIGSLLPQRSNFSKGD